ncbi:response regulator with CheY-like receiver, AAA-type ATPase, and DNA-binding domains [Rhizobium leguminosarum bv. trifolii WSM597]|uniref:Response regulator with CheY-like receiver, AAA-type ATPase, and DNA-binding domains n=1 Tax=Rhizobium leguminosarum bv. trifolii WSM597 TaxID=754764 RepID=J0GWZ4_RHILT|nr:response regulator [Rhizobium leguminosarum]EJB02160.1 response regulator with CheY-like receiver, AAA-type ATPase, and DNA-binding domains [Rhizobium leguminosarum bv. trifolii WSM597]
MTTETLAGLAILVVEDDYFIADELARALSRAGAQVVGPVGSLTDALALLDDTDHLDFALLDLNLDGESAIPVADRLTARNEFFAFVTGYGSGGIPSRFGNVKRLDKPVEIAQVVSVIRKGAASSTSSHE